MRTQRPTPILVMAILSFVFGGLGLMVVCCGGAGAAIISTMAKAPRPAAQPGAPNPFAGLGIMDIPEYKSYMIVDLSVSLLLALLLIACGFGLLKMQKWSRPLSIIWAILKILTVSASTIWSIAVLNPKMQEVMAKQGLGPAGNIASNPMLGNIGAVVGAVIGVSLPFAMIVVMFLPSVSSALAGRRPAPTGEPEDYYDQPSDDPPRETR
jgi:hypothetical protein